jgi:hypothetical protein
MTEALKLEAEKKRQQAEARRKLARVMDTVNQYAMMHACYQVEQAYPPEKRRYTRDDVEGARRDVKGILADLCGVEGRVPR